MDFPEELLELSSLTRPPAASSLMFDVHTHFSPTVPRTILLSSFIYFHFEKRIYTPVVRSYKILSPLECCRANIHCLNWQLLCLGPWYCGISAAAFRRSDLKENIFQTFYDLRFMIHGRLSGCELGSCQSCFWRCWTLQGVPRCSKCRQVRRERMPSIWQIRRWLSALQKRNTLPEWTRAQSWQSHEFAPGL